MNAPTLDVQMQGWYRLEAVSFDEHGNESVRTVADWFPNLITNKGLDEWCTQSIGTIVSGCYVGSGSTTPATSDTSLVSLVASRFESYSGLGNTATSVTGPPSYTYDLFVYNFPIGAAAGNLSEIGIGRTATNLFSRALILDSGGSPTTITILATESLRVTYELRCYNPTADSVAVINVGGVDYTVTCRPSGVGNTNFWPGDTRGGAGPAVLNRAPTYPYSSTAVLGPLTGAPSGLQGSQVNDTATLAAYTPGNYYRDMTFNFLISQFNAVGGLGAMTFMTQGSGKWQVGFSPFLPKDSTKTMSIVLRVAVGRYTI